MIVGNDVVDLELMGEPSEGFVARVLAPEERRAPPTAADVWRLWAAKEAAFKILARRDRRLPFVHARFVVDVEAGLVRHPRGEVRVRWGQHGAALGCVGWQGAGACTTAVATAEEAEAAAAGFTLSAREASGVTGLLSVAVRLLAKNLLCRRLGRSWTDVELLRPGAGPPEVWLGGAPAPDIGISLAHDGRFVACAVGLDASARYWP